MYASVLAVLYLIPPSASRAASLPVYKKHYLQLNRKKSMHLRQGYIFKRLTPSPLEDLGHQLICFSRFNSTIIYKKRGAHNVLLS